MEDIKYDWVVEDDARSWWQSYFSSRGLYDHTAKGFPSLYHQIFQHLISKYGINPKEHIILDQMCGIGTTLIIANLNHFDSIGIELEEVYYKDTIGFTEKVEMDMLGQSLSVENKVIGTVENFVISTGRLVDRIDNKNHHIFNTVFGSINIFNGDSTKPEVFSNVKEVIKDKKVIVVTSPPYTRISEHDQKQIDAMPEDIRGGFRPAGYKDPNNIAMKQPYEYRMAMSKIYKNLYDLGVELMVLVTRDFILGGEVFGLAVYNKFAAEFPAPKFELIEKIRAKIPTASFFKRINFEKYHKAKGLPFIDYEDIFFYRRKDKKEETEVR
jgi:SAM-dependent methyltransferase